MKALAVLFTLALSGCAQGFGPLDLGLEGGLASDGQAVLPTQAGGALAVAVAALTPGDPAGKDDPDAYIGDSEIQQALVLWIDNQPVPGTQTTISDTAMQGLLQTWISGARVGPVGAPTPRPGPGDEAAQLLRKLVPSLSQFTLVKLDMTQILSMAQRGVPFELPFTPARTPDQTNPVMVKLQPAGLIGREAEGALFRGDGNQTSAQKVQKVRLEPTEYAGEVLNTRGGMAGFTITQDGVLGAMWVPEGKATGWSFVEPLDALLRENGASQSAIARITERYNHVAYNATGIDIKLEIDADEPSAKVPEKPEPDGEAAALMAHLRSEAQTAQPEWVFQVNETMNIYLFSDVEFYNVNPATVWNRQRGVTLWVSLLYGVLEPGAFGNGEFDLPLNIVGQGSWVSGGPTSTDSATLLGQSYNMAPWGAIGINRNNVAFTHFFTGKNIDGTTIGRAWKIGGVDDLCGASYSTSGPCQHSFSQPDFSGTTFYLKIILMAHEVGHVMGALHSNFNPSYTAGSLTGPTIMRSSVTGSQVPYFSASNADTMGTFVYFECVAPIVGDQC